MCHWRQQVNSLMEEWPSTSENFLNAEWLSAHLLNESGNGGESTSSAHAQIWSWDSNSLNWTDSTNSSGLTTGHTGNLLDHLHYNSSNTIYSMGYPRAQLPQGGYDWIFLFVIFFIFAGGLGNILVCLAVALDRKLQNVTNYFLFSLAIADLLVSLFVMPLGAIPAFLGKLKVHDTLWQINNNG